MNAVLCSVLLLYYSVGNMFSKIQKGIIFYKWRHFILHEYINGFTYIYIIYFLSYSF